MESWQESFDLTGKKSGKYNILVTATDLGGNKFVEGPFNLYVDPKSDLPLCGITNPLPNMRVFGNLNIVGTCVDDDAVSYVELVLDGGEPIRASGTEGWSYYLDTNDLTEGPHTIKATGYDINGLASIPVTVTWQLDRRSPVTGVDSHGMGTLVSGTVKFSGVVADGNGIDSLVYSIDSWETTHDVKFLKSKDGYSKNFTVTVDTKKFEDGPQVLWFKATDVTGSVGIYSFLYFVDNTSPEVKILFPAEDDVQNGKVAVFGLAKDTVGIKRVSWKFGKESGDFELVPGNPYWGIVFDTIGSKDSSRKFTITAEDLSGNVVSQSQAILMNQADDLPTVVVSEPTEETFVETEDTLFVRGIATDDDGVASIKFKLDDGEWQEQETLGVFFADVAHGSELSPGKHTISVVAVDRNGVEGNPAVVHFAARGAPPEFSAPNLIKGKEAIPFVDGVEVHPEAGYSFQTKASCALGLSSVHYDIFCKDGTISKDYEAGGAASVAVDIPIDDNMARGVVRIVIVATDTAGRSVECKKILYVTNTSVVSSTTPRVVFEDSSINADGIIVNSTEFPASGYFIGGTASSVELVPSTPFASAELRGNQIVLVPGNAVGISQPVVVRVTTDQGLRFDSRPVTFKNDTIVPAVYMEAKAVGSVIDGEIGTVEVRGTADCQSGIASVRYRIFSARAEMTDGVLTALAPVAESSFVELGAVREFSIPVDAYKMGYGVYIVEVVAESAGGNKGAAAVCVRNIPALPVPAEGMKPILPNAPLFAWAVGENVYYAVAYQGNATGPFGTIERKTLSDGNNNVMAETSVRLNGKERLYTSKYKLVNEVIPKLDAHFAMVNDARYMSGMPIVIPADGAGKIVAHIDSDVSVSSVSYEISGEAVPGGSEIKRGSVKPAKPADGSTRYIAEIPLSGIPARMTKVALTIKAGKQTMELVGFVSVVRPSDARIDDSRAIYFQEGDDVFFNEDASSYIMAVGDTLNFYANVMDVASAELTSSSMAFSTSIDGNNVVVTATSEGSYPDVALRVRDSNGIAYTSAPLNIIVDSGAPEVVIASPALGKWMRKQFRLAGTVADPSGIRSGEYSLDGGETWKPLDFSFTRGNIGGTFNIVENVSEKEDGLIQIDVRVFDTAGNVAYARTAVQKDSVPPEVQVIMPEDDAVVNGDNMIAFRVLDEGNVAGVYYVGPPGTKAASKRGQLETEDSFVITHVGTKDMPIDDSMSFEFSDSAGNKTVLESWQFLIDSESDLPITEIHLPQDDEVITRDFTISGVVYDDDGPSTIYYRIDRGAYIELPEMGTSFAIDVPFSTMTDNEHTIYMYSVDINGVQGPVSERKFRVSTEEPKGAVVFPSIDTTVKGEVTIKGISSDLNGIDKVMISLDCGNSYNDTVGAEDWTYTFDTKAIPDGTHVIFFKIFDKYGIEALYSSLINIDNTNPDMTLELPLDDSTTTGPLFFSGFAFDNIGITEMFVKISSLESKSVNKRLSRVDFDLGRVISEVVDMSGLENGVYNIEVTARDKAGNETHASRNITLDKSKPLATVDLLYPLNGEHKQGIFNIYGEAAADKPIEALSLYIDGRFIADTQLTASGYFKFSASPEIIADGEHEYYVDARLEGGTVIRSRVQTLTYSTVGPWVTVDNFVYGDFAIERPYISGNAGYSLSEDELLISRTKEATKEQKEAVNEKKVEKVEISFDNGKSFKRVSKGEKWKHRIENLDLPEGYHFMIVRATMRNGETAIDRVIIQIDNTVPHIRLISPSVGGRYNQEMLFSGLSSDNIALKDVELTLRKGDKASYQVPSFIQGLYLDWNFWGATLFDIGIGLTFFDDNVKLQFQWGQFTQAQRNFFAKSDMRYGGDNVMGIKILANVGTIPFSYFFGRDWEWLTMNFAVGANFTRFNETNSGKPQILSALLAQMEFPRVSFPKNKCFSTFALYTEFSLWFIPTDVSGGNSDAIKNLIPQISEGIRVNVF
ncbi:MAG: Ig-like domain repeat protein [Treponemataceae bacterium]|nr:Ig-like domain repeat protein [Treponemataceae bacterium]